jgi:hypothetical protein
LAGWPRGLCQFYHNFLSFQAPPRFLALCQQVWPPGEQGQPKDRLTFDFVSVSRNWHGSLEGDLREGARIDFSPKPVSPNLRGYRLKLRRLPGLSSLDKKAYS